MVTIWDKDYEMRPTKMAVIDVGRKCNVKCKMCYYRYETFDAPEGKKQTWMKTLDELKNEVNQALQRGCNRVDFTGGEPTIHPNIIEIIQYCRAVRLEPRIITNGQSSKQHMTDIIAAGCKEFLFSLHDVGEKLSELMQVPKAWEKMVDTIYLAKKFGCRIGFNTVIYNENYNRLHRIAANACQFKPYIHNFINCNPQYEATPDKTKHIQAPVSDSAMYIENAIEVCNENDVWANVRYYPMCQLRPEYRKHIVNHPQVMFDWINEWDYGAYPKTVENYLKFGREAFQYKSDAQDGKCGGCGIRNVCGGLNLGYRQAHTDEEVIPQPGCIDYPFYYRAEQESVDIIVPAYRITHNLSRLLEEIQHKTQPPYNLIIIHKEKSAARNRNDGLKASKSKFVIMIDDDICELPYLWNKLLIDRLLYNPDVCAVSARLLEEEGRAAVNTANNFDLSKDFVEVDCIPTACCIFRNPSELELEFDERMMGSGWEDTLFFNKLKLRTGGKILIDNTVKVVHLNRETNNNQWFEYNKQIFVDEMTKEREKHDQNSGKGNM